MCPLSEREPALGLHSVSRLPTWIYSSVSSYTTRRLLFLLLYLDMGFRGLQVENKGDFPKKLAKWEAGEAIGHHY